MGVSAADVFAVPLGEIFGCFAMDDYEAWRGNVGKYCLYIFMYFLDKFCRKHGVFRAGF